MMIIMGLMVLILASYWQVQYYDFVDYDDQLYVTANFKTQYGMSWNSISSAFTDLHISMWHPLTMMSHALDWQLFGDRAGGHHWSSIILHIFNTILLFLLLNQMTGAIWRSAIVAALFGVHPINVESVAWVAERKNVLSTFFWFLTMLFYTHYVRKPDWKRYALVCLCFVLGLMAKPMLVTLPFVLLLMDYWPFNRVAIGTTYQTESPYLMVSEKRKPGGLIWEKLPLFILSGLSVFMTIYAAKSASTIMNGEVMSVSPRIYNAILSYGTYLRKLFWPVDLAVFYPMETVSVYQMLPSALLIIAITVVCCRYFKKYPYLSVGWFWYLGILVPVIGLVQVGSQSMADRYAYIPSIGIFVALVWIIADFVRRRPAVQKISLVLSVCLIAILCMATRYQTEYWRDSSALFQRALDETHRNYFAHVGIANELIKQNKLEEATNHLHTAINLNPANPANYVAYIILGKALDKQGKKTEAITEFKNALRIKPVSDEAYHRIGFILFQEGRVDEAVEAYRKAISLNNDYPTYHDSLGNAYLTQGKIKEAIHEYQEVLRIQPVNAIAYNNLGMIFMNQGKADESVKYFLDAVKIEPTFANAHFRLSVLYRQKGMDDRALYHYNEAVRLNPRFKDLK